MSIVSISCFYCKNIFFRDTKHANENKKLKHKFFCSLICLTKSRTKKIKVLCENPHCRKIFEKKLSEISNTTHNYCSRSCAVTVNNSKFPKHPGIKKICAYCKKVFVSRDKFCSLTCKIKNQTITASLIITQIKEFYQKNGRIPLKREFHHSHVARKRFGSWNKAIIAAGFKQNPVKFSKKYFAKDGHKCDSLAEMIIDNWFSIRDIKHARSVPYPGNHSLTVDFVVGKYWIEFFGLYGEHRRYDELRKEKLLLAEKYKLYLIELYPIDLFSKNKFDTILSLVIASY